MSTLRHALLLTSAAEEVSASDASHAHAADAAGLLQSHIFIPSDNLHAQTAEEPSTSAGDIAQPDDSVEAHSAESPTLSQIHILAVSESLHAAATDQAGLLQSHLIVAEEAIQIHQAEAAAAYEVQIALPSETLHVQAVIQPSVCAVASPPAMEWAHYDIPPASTWALDATEPRREIYIAVLRAEGFDDLEVPMKSMQLRRRDGYPTMISCVIPDAMTYLEDAQDRKGGEIIIYAGSVTQDGTRHLSELERATLETITYDHGVENSSLSLSGYRTASNENPRPIDLDGLTYYGLQADGKRRVRGVMNIFLRPGDTAIYGGYSMVVDQIYVKVEAANAWMEVAGI